MPFFRLNKNSKQFGIQTYAKAIRLPDTLREVELEYLDARDWYMQTVGVLAQFQEALQQAKAENRPEDAKLFGNKIQALEGDLVDVRQRVRDIGEKSYAEAYYLAARLMLPKDTHKAIEIETEKLLGRARHELARQK